MRNMFRSFARDEEGAITVDWVLLVAVVITLSFLVVAPVLISAGNLGAKVGAVIAALEFGW